MSTEVTNSIDVSLDTTEVTQDNSITVTSSAPYEITPQDANTTVEGYKKEYSIVGDGIYASVSADEAPEWLLGLIDSVVSQAVANGMTDYDLLVQDVRDAIDSIDVAKNTYVEQVNVTALVDGILATHLETLNATIGNTYATKVELTTTLATTSEALAQDITDLSVSFNGELDSRITQVQTAYANADSAIASDVSALTSAYNSQGDDLAAAATAVSGLQTYVGLTGDNLPDGTGLLSRVSILESQNDGVVEYTAGLDDVMIGVTAGDNDPSDDQLDVTKEPYASWVAEDTTNGDEAVRSSHLGDVYILYSEDPVTGLRVYEKSYKFIKTAVDTTSPYSTDAQGYTWALIADTDAQAAYIIALNAYDLATDNKRRVFIETPYTPYDEGDLWIDNISSPQVVKVSTVTKASAQSYSSGDWVQADQYALDFVNSTYTPDSAQIHRQLDGQIEYYFYESYTAISGAVDELNALDLIDNAWNTNELKDEHNGDIVYFKDSRQAYWYQASTPAWLTVTDTSIYEALQNAAAAQGAADGRVSQFYAWGGVVAPSDYTNANGVTVSAVNFQYWFKPGESTLYYKPETTWVTMPTYSSDNGSTYISLGDIVTVLDPSDGDLTSYVYNGTNWAITGPEGIIANSEYFINLDAAVNGTNGVAQAVADLNISVEAYARNSDNVVLSGLSAVDVGWTTDPTVTIGESDLTPIEGCQSALTYVQAVKYAKDRGLRLPTASEVMNGVGKSTGCGFDGALIWTSTPGLTEGTNYVVMGKYTGIESDISELDSTSSSTATAACRFVADSHDDLNSATLHAQTKFEYNAPVTINGITQNAGFGLVNEASSVTGAPPTGESEFWVDANKFVLKNPDYPGYDAFFTVTSSGVTLGLDFTEATRNVPAGTYSSTTTYQQGDIVTYNNSSYVALISTNAIPSNDGVNWQLLAAQGVSPLLYEWAGATAWPDNTTETGAISYTFDSIFSGNVVIRVKAYDAEGSSTSGVRIKFNDSDEIPFFRTLGDSTEEWYEFTFDNLLVGTNTIKFWSTAADGGQIREIQAAFVGAQGLAGAYTDFLFTRSVNTPADPGGANTWYTDVNSVPAGAGDLWSIKKVVSAGGVSIVYSDKRVIDAPIIRELTIYSNPTISTIPAPTSSTFDFTNNTLTVNDISWHSDIPSSVSNGYTVLVTTALVSGNSTETSVPVSWSTPSSYITRVDGQDGTNGNTTAQISVYKRSAAALSAPTGGSYNFDTSVITPPTGWSYTIPTGTDPVYSTTALAFVVGNSGTDSDLTWSTPTILVQNGTDGSIGKSVYTATVFVRSATAPVAPTGGSFNFGTNVLEPPTGWSLDVPDGTNPVYGTRFVFSISGDTGSQTATTWSTPFRIAEDGSDGIPGLSVYRPAIYRRSASALSAPTGGSYDFGTNTLTAPAYWYITPPVGTDPLYVSSGMASIQGATGIDSSITWTTPSILVQDGTNGTPGANNAVVSMYIASTNGTTVPTSFSGTATYTFSTGAVTGLTFNGWSYTPPALTTGQYLWVRQAVASSTAATDTIDITEWSTAVVASYAGTDGNPGTNGLNSKPLFLYRKNTSTTEPTAFTGTATYVFSTDSLTGLTLNSWTRTAPSISNGEYLWMRSAMASSNAASDTIDISEWSTASVVGVGGMNGAPGDPGSAGAGFYRYGVSGFSGAWPSTSTANYYLFEAAGRTPVTDDILTIYNSSDVTTSATRRYDGTYWVAAALTVDGDMIATGTITAPKLKAGTITADRLSISTAGNILDDVGLNSGLITVGTYTTNTNVDNETTVSVRAAGRSWAGVSSNTLEVRQNGTTVDDYEIRYKPAIGSENDIGYPAKANNWYEGSVYASTHRCGGSLLLVFRDSTNTELESWTVSAALNNNDQVSSTNPDEWTRYHVKGQAPAGTVAVQVVVIKNGTNPGSSDSYIFLHKPQIVETTEYAVGPTPWSTGGQTVISGDTITTGTLDANIVDVVNLNADNITAGTITTDLLKIDGVTLDTDGNGNLQISGGGVDTTQLASNAATDVGVASGAATVSIGFVTSKILEISYQGVAGAPVIVFFSAAGSAGGLGGGEEIVITVHINDVANKQFVVLAPTKQNLSFTAKGPSIAGINTIKIYAHVTNYGSGTLYAPQVSCIQAKR